MRISQCREVGKVQEVPAWPEHREDSEGNKTRLDYQDAGIRGVMCPEPSPLLQALV